MSDNFINQLTLDCLMNKDQYKQHVQSKIQRSIGKEERRFYRKRILDLTRDLLSKPSFHEQNVLPDVKYAFQNYVKTCVEFFKSQDSNDIIQGEYNNYILDASVGEDALYENINADDPDVLIKKKQAQEAADKLLMRSVKMEKPLDKLVIRTCTKKPDEIIIPKQKDIDLTNPILKEKGIIKRQKKVKEQEN
jgi:hypothetical protein